MKSGCSSKIPNNWLVLGPFPVLILCKESTILIEVSIVFFYLSGKIPR
jgi:hypothetical protein